MSQKTVFLFIAFMVLMSACGLGRIAGFSVDDPTNISGTVWLDENGNGLQDDGEVGVDKVTVNLISSLGYLLEEQITNLGGVYVFKDLDPERVYSIRVVLPPGYAFTQMDVGDNDFIDSDVHNAGSMIGQTDELANLMTGDNPFVDAGLTGGPATDVEDENQVVIAGFVWLDINGDGQYDALEEDLLAGVEVQLVETDVQLVGLLEVVETVKTDSGGLFVFSERAPSGIYRLFFENPSDYAFTKKDAAADEKLDSDVEDSGHDEGYTDAFDLAQGAPQDLAAGMVFATFIPMSFSEDLEAHFTVTSLPCGDMASNFTIPYHMELVGDFLTMTSDFEGSTATGTIDRNGDYFLEDVDGRETFAGNFDRAWKGTATNLYKDDNNCVTPFEVEFTPLPNGS